MAVRIWEKSTYLKRKDMRSRNEDVINPARKAKYRYVLSKKAFTQKQRLKKFDYTFDMKIMLVHFIFHACEF